MSARIQILIVEDVPPDAELAMREIRKSLGECVFQRVETERDYLEALEKFKPDLILSDYHLPQFTGMKALELAQERVPRTPLIIITGSLSENVAVDCMRAGAANYIIKENIKRLGTAVAHALEEKKVRLERDQAEQAVQASERKYRMLHESMMDGFVSLTMEGKFLECNAIYRNMLGYSEADLAQLTYMDITPEKWHSFEKDIVENQILKQGYSDIYEKEYRRKDGTIFPVELHTVLMRDEQGKPTGMWAIVRDITERKKVEVALRESELRFRTFIEQAPVAILISRNGIIEYVNQKDAQLFGLQTGEDVVGRPVIEYLAPASQVESKEHTRRRSVGLPVPSEFEYLGLRPDGSQFPIQVAITNVQLPDGKANISFITDITERRQAQKALQENEQRFRSIFENSMVGIYRTTPAGQILMANPAMVSMLGYQSFEELAKRDLEVDVFEPAYPRSRFRELIEKYGEVRNLESAWKRQDGKVLYIRESAKAFRNPDGTVEYYEGSAEDITDRKQAEDAMRASEERYRSLFEDSPISLWEEDFSAVKLFIEDLRKQGVTDFRTYFRSHPERVRDCFEQVRIVDMNRAGLKLLGAKGKAEVPSNPSSTIPDDAHEYLGEELVNISEGKSEFEWQGIKRTLAGERRVVNCRWSVAPGHEDTLDKVLLSMVDVTEQKQNEEQIRVLSRIPDESPNPILRATTEGVLLYANPASGCLLDMWKTQVGQRLADEWRVKIGNVFGSGQYQEVEVRCEEKVYSLILAPIVDAGYVNLYGREITLRKQAERALARQTEELRDRNDELDRLYQASGSLLSSPSFDLQSLATTIVNVVLKQFGQANCSLIIVQKDSNELVRLAVGGPYADQVKDKKLALDGPGLVPQAISTGVVIHSDDVRLIPGFTPHWDAVRSELTIPLKVGSNVIGVIDIQSSETGAFQADDERLMSVFAEQAAMALDRTRLYAQTEQRLQNLNSLRTVDMAISSSMDMNLTLGILLEQVMGQFGAHAADVLIFDSTTQSFRFSTGRGFRTQALQHTDLRLGDGYAGRAARERQMILIQELTKNTGELRRSAEFSREGFVTYIGIPLIAKGQVKGVLEIFQRSPFDPNPERLAFLEMLAGQAAIAIDSAQLFENLQVTNSELMMAYDETIEGWSRAMDLRDKETEGHTRRVTELTLRLANSMGFGAGELVHIRRGTLLHDIGKMGVPDEILRKPGALTEDEWVIMRRHPQLAYDMLAPIIYLRPAIDIP